MTFQCVAEIFLQYLRLNSRKKSFYGDFNPDICTQTCDDDRLIKFFYKQKVSGNQLNLMYKFLPASFSFIFKQFTEYQLYTSAGFKLGSLE